VLLQGVTVGAGGIFASGAMFTANGLHVTGTPTGVHVLNGSVAWLSNPTIEGSTESGIQVGDSSSLTLNGGTLQDDGQSGITVAGGRADIRNAQITGNENGVEVQFGGAAAINGSTIADNSRNGIHGYLGSTLNIGTGTVVEDNQTGVIAQSADVTLWDMRVEHNQTGVIGLTGALVSLSNGSAVESNDGDGISLLNGSVATILPDAKVSDNGWNGIELRGTGTLWIEGLGTRVITGNGGWGISCDPAPSTPLVLGTLASIGTVSGNGAGASNCAFVG